MNGPDDPNFSWVLYCFFLMNNIKLLKLKQKITSKSNQIMRQMR